MLGLAHDTALAAPTIRGTIAKVAKPPLGLAAGRTGLSRRGHLGGDLRLETIILGQAEQVIDPMGFAPAHQRIAGKARVGPQHDAALGPVPANVANEALDLFHTACCGVSIGAAQFGYKQMTAAEDVERQIAVTAVVTMEEASFLIAVQGIISRIQIKYDLLRGLGMCLDEAIDKQGLECTCLMGNLVIAIGLLRRGHMFEPVQRGLARQRLAPLAPCLQLTPNAAITGSRRS